MSHLAKSFEQPDTTILHNIKIHIFRPDDDLFGAGPGGLASSRSDGNLGGGGGGHLSYEMGELTGTVNSEHKAALVGRAEQPLSR